MNKYLNPKKYINWLKSRLIGKNSTYSQTGEDLILNLFFKKNDGFYVDIGANNPRLFNNTYLFYLKGWRGINIEPSPNNIKLFYRTRKKDINLNIGISSQKDNLNFYIMDESTLSTFSKDTADEYKKMGHHVIETKKVQTKRLDDVLRENLPKDKEIDFFSIDTEGFDKEVLKSNDWSKYRPKFIIIETLEYKNDGSGKKLNEYYDSYFKEIGYKKIADTYINTIYQNERS